jgi:hypothetical protein
MALLATFFLVETRSILTASTTAPSEPIRNVTVPTSGGASVNRMATAAEPSRRAVESDDRGPDEAPHANTSAIDTPTVDERRIEEDTVATNRGPTNDRSSATWPSASGETAATPLGWCFRSHSGFTWQETPLGSAPQHEFVSDKSVVWHGSASVRIAAADYALPAGVVGVMWQGISARPFRGKRVEMSAFARTRITNPGHFFIRTQASAPLELLLSDQKAPGARGLNQYMPRDADWARYRVVHDVPADAEVMYYGFALYGGGAVWIDDLRISIVDENSPLTHSSSVGGNQIIAIDPGWILPGPLNLDFEVTSDGPTGGEETLDLSCTRQSAN